MNERVGDIEMLNKKKQKEKGRGQEREIGRWTERDQSGFRRMTRERFLLTDDARAFYRRVDA